MSEKVYFIVKNGYIDSYSYDYAIAEYYLNTIDAMVGEGKYKIKPMKIKKISPELLAELEYSDCEKELWESYENENEECHVVLNNIDREGFDYHVQTAHLNVQTLINKLDFSLTYLKFSDKEEREFVRDTLLGLKKKYTEYQDKIYDGAYEDYEYGIPVEDEYLNMEELFRQYIGKSKQ